ncbi:putative leucine-rich repeat-containing protein DDB_G0290503 [Bradysia coprophila]|uniref:putative leucine-rich repeat-containing protein DDB_G0290503 n=1 Tax=Bradysia coprophila TaxID=38358 RepID=UPI00187DD40A|nr:putative leucine-rich repeat-containing protein DDB_G0290503 [Bradysia coprophila]
MEFNDEIEDDGSTENDRNQENVQHVVVLKQSKTTPQQIQTITESFEEICGKKLSKQDLNLFWDKLTTELNNVGPPFRTSDEWRRVWIMHKANKKRKYTGSNQGQQDSSKLNVVNAESSHVEDRGPSELILEKLNHIIDQQNNQDGHFDLIYGKLNHIEEKQNEFVNQTGDTLQREHFAGVQRSNINDGPLDNVLYKLDTILDKLNDFVNEGSRFDLIPGKTNHIVEKQNEFVDQTGDTLQRGHFAGVQRSNINDNVLYKLDTILDKLNDFVNEGSRFDLIPGKTNHIVEKQNEFVDQTGDTLQRGHFAGVQRSNINDNVLYKLDTILDKLNDFVNEGSRFDLIPGKTNHIVEKQNEFVDQTGDTLQRGHFAGVQRSNINDNVLYKLDTILDKLNDFVNQGGRFDLIFGKLNHIVEKQNEVIKLQRELIAGVQRSNINDGPMDNILYKLDPILDKISKILDQQSENKK